MKKNSIILSVLAMLFIGQLVCKANESNIVANTIESASITSNERVRYKKVDLVIYDKKTGEYKWTEKDVTVWKNPEGFYEIKFIYGWYKVKRSNKKGYKYCVDDGWGIYYFNM